MPYQKRAFSVRFSNFLVLVQYFERAYFPFYFKYFYRLCVVLSEKSYIFICQVLIFSHKNLEGL